jgi:hypothetical protein
MWEGTVAIPPGPPASFSNCLHVFTSAALKGPRKLLRIRPAIFDVEPDLGLTLWQTNPRKSGAAPTNRHATIPNDSGPVSASFDDDPKLLKRVIAQPSHGSVAKTVGKHKQRANRLKLRDSGPTQARRRLRPPVRLNHRYGSNRSLDPPI